MIQWLKEMKNVSLCFYSKGNWNWSSDLVSSHSHGKPAVVALQSVEAALNFKVKSSENYILFPHILKYEVVTLKKQESAAVVPHLYTSIKELQQCSWYAP